MFSTDCRFARFSRIRLPLAACFVFLAAVGLAPSALAGCPEGQAWVSSSAGLDNGGAESSQSGYCAPVPGPKHEPEPQKPGRPAQPIKVDPYNYAYAYACGGTNLSALSVGHISGEPCDTAAVACEFQGAESGAQRLRVFRRLKTGGPWQMSGTTCGASDLPPGVPAPPPIPTVAQIQAAFLRLPFAKPSVNIQPEGDVTLVNLPTYFEAKWPAAKLGPGDISAPVQLLSWSIEFRIDPATYNYDFGDGTFSGATEDLGGPYPEGLIRHTYKQPNPAVPVKVDAELTGSYRVNGGANWIPLNGVADLQDEPVVTLEVREAKARLYNNG